MKKNYFKIICVLILIGCKAFTQIPTDSLVAYFPFNTNANDSSGNGYIGSLNGQYSIASSCGRAYYFSDNYIDCGDPMGNQFDLINTASISLWIALFGVPSTSGPGPYNGYFTIIGKDVGPGNNEKWFLAITSHELIFHVNAPNAPSSSGGWAIQTILNFALNNLYHIVVTKTGNTYSFYVNGVNYGSQTMPLNIIDVPYSLQIGDLHDGSNPIKAVIDEVLIYHKALTQTEVNQLFAHCPSGVITAINTISQDPSSDLKIYPNPSSGKFVLSFDNQMIEVKNVSVFNVLGEKVFEQRFQLYGRDVIIDLENKPKGVYLLQVQTRKKIMVSKIAVQ